MTGIISLFGALDLDDLSPQISHDLGTPGASHNAGQIKYSNS